MSVPADMSVPQKPQRTAVTEAQDAPLGTTIMAFGHGRSGMVRARDNRIASLPQVLLNAVCDFLYVHEHVVFSTCSVAVRAQLVKPCSWRVVVDSGVS